MALFSWSLHGDGRAVAASESVGPKERLSWPRTIGIGAQHVLAMFGSTFVVPTLTGFPPSTTLFFSAIGTALFLIITKNQLPSYLGSSFAFIAPITVATAGGYGMSGALGGIVVIGVMLALVGLVVHLAGTRWIEITMPPIVTGSIVAVIGINLASAAWGIISPNPGGGNPAKMTAAFTVLMVLVVTVFFRGMIGRLAILVAAILGGIFAAIRGEWNLSGLADAGWFGLPEFHTPTFHPSLFLVFFPILLVLIAENVGHVKSVALMTGENLDKVTGKALFADGAATTLAGLGGGSGTTTYAENIGVMAATRVYSTAAYWFAALFALCLAMIPKFGAFIAALPNGVLGGLATVLFGMITILGARIWVENKVNFANPVNLITAGIAIIIGAADYTWTVGDLTFNGIALGTGAALFTYHFMSFIAKKRGTLGFAVNPATLPQDADEATATAETN